MSARWKILLSSATDHERLVSELYIDGTFALLVSNDDGIFEVELSNSANSLKLPYDEFVDAVRACVESLRAVISTTAISN